MGVLPVFTRLQSVLLGGEAVDGGIETVVGGLVALSSAVFITVEKRRPVCGGFVAVAASVDPVDRALLVVAARVPGFGGAIASLGGGISLVRCIDATGQSEVAGVRGSVSLVRESVSLVGNSIAFVGYAIAFVGYAVAFVCNRVSCRRELRG